jgi:uncharacterized protein (TIGR02265 family)
MALEAHATGPLFRMPREDAPVDLEAHVQRLHPRATVKGLFFADLVATVSRRVPGLDVIALAGLPSRRYLPFIDYPCADWLRLKIAASELLFPRVPRGVAMRRLGRMAFPAFMESRAGRLMFELAAPRIEDALARAPQAYAVISNAGVVEFERPAPRTADIVFVGFPGFLETYQVGIVEGVCAHYSANVTIEIALRTIADGTIRVRW